MNLSNIKAHFWEGHELNPQGAGWEERTVPLCYAGPLEEMTLVYEQIQILVTC